MFNTKAEAQAWSVQREAEMRRLADTGINTDKLVSDAFDRYAREVSPTKRKDTWEENRLLAIRKHAINGVELGKMKLSEVTSDTIGRWRDMRLKEVEGSTINRDLALLSHVFKTACKEWKWMATSPTTDVRRPENPPSRDRRIQPGEIDQICLTLGFDGSPVKTKNQAVAVAFLFAIETAMRAGEICAIWPELVRGRSIHLPAEIVKNGVKRDVPLSKRAMELLSLLPVVEPRQPLFGLTSSSLDALFRKARNQTLIEGLKFHDTRHEAITRLASKLNVLELARMVGHRDLKMLQIYYNASAEDLACLLD